MKNKELQEIKLDRRLSVAPMLDHTDRYCRYFLRQISRRTLLYTEMITTGALLHRDPARFLDYHPAEHPLAIQLGGSEPDALAACAGMADEWGYDEINLNVGCPSDRVQSGRFGACLMAEPDRVAECMSAMRTATQKPVTIKHRIGIDEMDSYEALARFVDTIANAGCDVFIVHARKAWLHGLNPKQNRDIPPLRYDVVHQLKRDFPDLTWVINGGFTHLAEVDEQLQQLDGVMIGREVYRNPWLLADVDHRIYVDQRENRSRRQVVESMLPFIEHACSQGTPLHRITRHMSGLYQGQPGARKWRRYLSEHAHQAGTGVEIIENALRSILAA